MRIKKKKKKKKIKRKRREKKCDAIVSFWSLCPCLGSVEGFENIGREIILPEK